MPVSKAAVKTVDSYIAALESPQQEISKLLQQLIRKAGPKLEESLKWGTPCYSGTANVCSIMAFKNHVNLAFFRGAELADKKGLLEGTGKAMRHVKLCELKDVKKAAITGLVKEAVGLDGG
jgi:hypothetical protein